MRLLAIDTAGPACAVAILRAEGGALEALALASESLGKGHAERLMPMIEAALAEAGVVFSDLDRIAVTTGPGSFTGVRVGVAAARGLALALDIPAVGVGSLDALALPVVRRGDAGTVVAALDARRGEVFALAKDLGSGKALFGATAASAALLAAKLTEARPPLLLIGAGAPMVADALSGREVEIVGTPEYPDIVDVGRLGISASESAPPAPLYARAADAKPQTDKVLLHR